LQVQVDKISTTAREKIEKAGGTVTLREARRSEKTESDVATSEAEPDAAVATAKPRVKKSKSRKKKSE
ncbi:MAG TPA: uL15m family ribosomal protein, partial [Anaerolineae bacterium]|nr:uL15m family ribosomal protein [Anaerolineae bacterium]